MMITDEKKLLDTSLPSHGRISCARCFGAPTIWNVTQMETLSGWHIVNNPLSWGSPTPKFLLLGVSKGTRQCEALNNKSHDEVPFDGFRPKLTDSLRLLGLLSKAETIDEKIDAAEKDWSFGSMVRCSLGLVNQKLGNISRSGSIVERLAKMAETDSWLAKCSSAFLSRLPSRLRVCVLLSNDNDYIDASERAISRLRPSTRRINSVAYGDEQVTWVHIVHVGGPGRNHIRDWFEGNGTQGRKRTDAQEAVAKAFGEFTKLIPKQTMETMSRFPKRSKVTAPSTKSATHRGPGKPLPSNSTRHP